MALNGGHIDGYESMLTDRQRHKGLSGDHGAIAFFYVQQISIGNEVLSAHHILASIKITYIE